MKPQAHCSSGDPARGAKKLFLTRSGRCLERKGLPLRFGANLEMRDRLSLHWGGGANAGNR
jgi:hypothetical protein